MLHGSSSASTVAQQVVDYLRGHDALRSHGRRVSLFDLQARGVKVADVRTVPPHFGHMSRELGTLSNTRSKEPERSRSLKILDVAPSFVLSN